MEEVLTTKQNKQKGREGTTKKTGIFLSRLYNTNTNPY